MKGYKFSGGDKTPASDEIAGAPRAVPWDDIGKEAQ
jgi:hypothetical protein